MSLANDILSNWFSDEPLRYTKPYSILIIFNNGEKTIVRGVKDYIISNGVLGLQFNSGKDIYINMDAVFCVKEI